jgi:hypothetical protein
MPSGSEAPSNPAVRYDDKKPWIEGECGVEGRRTCLPIRVTAPALATPPVSCSSSTQPVWPVRPGVSRGIKNTAHRSSLRATKPVRR